MSICNSIKEEVKITDFAAYLGFTVIKKGKYFSLKEHDSVIIDIRKNCYWQNSMPGKGKSIGHGGSVIDFAINVGNMDLHEAIKALKRYGNITTAKSTYTIQKAVKKPKKEEKKLSFIEELELLELSAKNMDNVLAYLIKARKISAAIVKELKKRGMLYQDKNNNCVFVSYDIKDKTKPIFACKRGSNTYKPFYGDVPACDYTQCFYVDNNSEKVFITESVIDAMSIMTIIGVNWQKFNYIALAGVGKWEAVKTYLENTDIKELYIALDNDEKGVIAAQQICSYVKSKRPDIKRRWNLPNKAKGKDWNEVLKNKSY